MKKTTLSDSDRNAVAQSVKHARLVKTSRMLARIVRHIDPDAGRIQKRTELEKSLKDWIKFFGEQAFDSEFSADHLKIISKLESAMNDGGMFALAMPRGHGKTTIIKWAVLYVMLTGLRKYVVLIAATAEMAQSLVEFCRTQITESDLLNEYYPHVTKYARETDGKAILARYQLRADGKTSGIWWSSKTLVFPDVLTPDGQAYPSNGSICEGYGLTGAIRGKWKDSKSGKVLRPDLVICDDPQTRESAESESQCQQRENIIVGDVMGLAGPRKKIAAVMPCTIIRKGDMADRFLDRKIHPEWQGDTCQLVYSWPDEDEGLWAQYCEMYRTGVSDGRGFGDATAFYAEHQKAMDKGAVISWSERIRDGEISAIQTAYNLRIETGDQFWSEYQNAPKAREYMLYEITPSLVSSRVNNYKRREVDKDVRAITAFADINFSGMWWAVIGFRNDRTGYILDYGKHPEHGALVPNNATDAVKRRLVAEGIVTWVKKISALQFLREGRIIPIRAAGIDRGFLPDVVHQMTRTIACQFPVLPVRGYGGQQYRPEGKHLIGKAGHYVHFSESPNGQFLASLTDYFKEIVQRGFLASPGAPGSLSFWGKAAVFHYELAQHICSEVLVDKAEGMRGTFWRWKQQPGTCNDGLDAVTGCYSLASWYMGAPASEAENSNRQRVTQKQKPKLRKPKVSIVE
jgi:hypothetical protein